MAGDDRLFGERANDTLLGNTGVDTADGGTGTANRCAAESEVNCQLDP